MSMRARAFLLVGLGWPVLLTTQSIAQVTDQGAMVLLYNMCPEVSWPAGKIPKNDDEFVALLEAAKQWHPGPNSGLPRNACVISAAALSAFLLDKRYPDKAEADRHYSLVIQRALGSCPNGWVC